MCEPVICTVYSIARRKPYPSDLVMPSGGPRAWRFATTPGQRHAMRSNHQLDGVSGGCTRVVVSVASWYTSGLSEGTGSAAPQPPGGGTERESLVDMTADHLTTKTSAPMEVLLEVPPPPVPGPIRWSRGCRSPIHLQAKVDSLRSSSFVASSTLSREAVANAMAPQPPRELGFSWRFRHHPRSDGPARSGLRMFRPPPP